MMVFSMLRSPLPTVYQCTWHAHAFTRNSWLFPVTGVVGIIPCMPSPGLFVELPALQKAAMSAQFCPVRSAQTDLHLLTDQAAAMVPQPHVAILLPERAARTPPHAPEVRAGPS